MAETVAKTRNGAMRMTVRSITALIGGYAAAAGIATLAARLLPLPRAEATAWGMILSFLIYAAFGLWAFHERRLAIVAPAIWGAAAVSIGLAFVLGVRP